MIPVAIVAVLWVGAIAETNYTPRFRCVPFPPSPGAQSRPVVRMRRNQLVFYFLIEKFSGLIVVAIFTVVRSVRDVTK